MPAGDGVAGGEVVGRIGWDRDRFEEFYVGHVDAVTRFVARRVTDPYLAADLVSEVFLAAICAAGEYRPERGPPAAWLFGIARNVVAGQWRRARFERDALARLQGRRLLEEDDIARLTERIDAEAEARRVYQAISGLPRRERAVVELVAVDGLALPAAAAVLGIRQGAARMRMHRARRALREVLGSRDPGTHLSRFTEPEAST